MRFSTKFWLFAMLFLLASYFTASVILLVLFFSLVIVALYGAAYYRGEEVAIAAIEKAKLEIGSNLKCELCGAVPHLTELDNKFVCDACMLKHWASHCPVCGMDVPLEDVKGRLNHLNEHEKKGEI